MENEEIIKEELLELLCNKCQKITNHIFIENIIDRIVIDEDDNEADVVVGFYAKCEVCQNQKMILH